MNEVYISGILKDIEYKYVYRGKHICILNGIIVNRYKYLSHDNKDINSNKLKDKNKEKSKYKSNYINIIAYDDIADKIYKSYKNNAKVNLKVKGDSKICKDNMKVIILIRGKIRNRLNDDYVEIIEYQYIND